MPAALRLLAVEAGGERISAALFEDGHCVASGFEEARQRQTERMAPLLQNLLEQRAWKAESLGAIAAGRGPGSFTGLRSSLALGEGLALGSRARLVGIDTLVAWAQATSLPKVAVVLDGRRGQAYVGRYEKLAGAWQAQEEPALLAVAEAWSRVAGWALVSDLDAPLARAPLPQGAALAEAVGQLAWDRWKGIAGAPMDWEPHYLRRAEAAILWEKLHPKAG